MTLTPLAPGELAAIVTFLEMREPPPAPEVPPSPLRLERIEQPEAEAYRRLFRSVGQRWLWFSRLALDDEALLAVIRDPSVELFAVLDEHSRESGILELDFRKVGECELAFVGLVPELAGRGHGRWLLGEALARAWRDEVRRVHVHTCTLDHPAALAAYLGAGFTPVARAIERFPDPRLAGLLPTDCAPQLPLLGTEA